jgi:hypothetical protein
MKKYIVCYHISQNHPTDEEILDVKLIETDDLVKVKTIFMKWFVIKYPESYLQRLLCNVKEHSSIHTIGS